jgi:D-alanine-D-alanine ligase
VLCEAFIDGIELTCPVLGQGARRAHCRWSASTPPKASTTTRTSTSPTTVAYRIPSGLSAAEEAEVQRLTLAAYRALGCRGWGRADLMLRASDRRPFLLEMNTSPGMTGHSLVPMSAQAAGIGYPQLCLQLLAAATLDSAR